MASADWEIADEEAIKAIPEEYTVLELLGKGASSKVVKCLKKETGEKVAIKLIYRGTDDGVAFEVQLLEKLKDAHADRANMVKFLEQIETPIGKGLVFECLDMTLHSYLRKEFPLPLCDIRAIIEQMAVALGCLEAFGCVHTDLKPDNIMIHGSGRPLQAKLIDFGLVKTLPEAKEGIKASLIMYRAPEVFLGCPYDAAIDVWSLGVLTANVMMNTGLFPRSCQYEALRAIVKLLGQPPDKILNQGRETRKFFKKSGNSWRLKTRRQYTQNPFLNDCQCHFTEKYPSFSAVIKTLYENRRVNMEELDCCIDLLEKMLDVNCATRITAADIGDHPFIKNDWVNVQPARQMTEGGNTTARVSLSEPSIDPYTAEEVQALLAEQYAVVCIQGFDDFDHQMVKCRRKDTGELVSVKISYSGLDPSKEARLLKGMMRKGLEKRNVAQYLESVDFGASQALVFEELDKSLAEYLYHQRKIPILEARTITQQAATALSALEELKIIHANLSMNSIWFCDENRTKIKMMDFRSAMYSNDVRQGKILSQHRAPEIILGLPITEAVDVWSLGNILATMLLGFSIFPQEDDFETLKVMVALLGPPPDDILDAGTRVTHFFKKTAGGWMLMTNEEYAESQGLNPRNIRSHYTERFKSLKHLIKKTINGGMCGNLYHDDCIDLLRRMFQIDAAKRIKPSQILQHRFFQEDGEDEEEEEEEDENDPQPPPPQVKAAQPKDTTRVPCITELSRVEHELVAPETVQVFPDRIDNTLLTLHGAKDVPLDQRIPLGHTVPRFHSFQPSVSGLPGVETGASELRATNNSNNSTQATAGKSEDGGNEQRVPLKGSLMMKEEPEKEEEKKEEEEGEEKKEEKKKSRLRRVWSWVKKRFSCWNAVDDDDDDSYKFTVSCS